jgi:hypothetical protein
VRVGHRQASKLRDPVRLSWRGFLLPEGEWITLLKQGPLECCYRAAGCESTIGWQARPYKKHSLCSRGGYPPVYELRVFAVSGSTKVRKDKGWYIFVN